MRAMPARARSAPAATDALPKPFAEWFRAKGWTPRPHQLELLAKAAAGRSTLLIAPTGAGKTLAGFLPSLVALHARERQETPGRRARHPHALYLAAEGARRRYRAQPRGAGRRDRPEGEARNPHRRHLRRQAPASEAETAGHPAGDAGAGGPAAGRARRRPFLRRPRHRHLRRTARAGHQQARRSPLAGPGAAAHARAEPEDHRPLRHRRRSRRACAAGWCRSRPKAPERLRSPTSSPSTAAPNPTSRSSTPTAAFPWSGHTSLYALPDIYAAIGRHQHGASVRQRPQPGRADLPVAVAHEHRGLPHRAPSRLA